MSIDHLKKQSKNLKRLWPEFAQAHGNTPTLAACQELIARCSGYASWHAATMQDERKPEAGATSPEVDDQGETVLRVERCDFGQSDVPEVRFAYVRPEGKPDPTERLDAFLEEHDGLFEEHIEMSTKRRMDGLRELEALCRTLTFEEPDMLDAHAHLVAARVSLGRPEEAIKGSEDAWNRASALLQGREGRVSYYELSNRPFHRLAHGLVRAHLAVAKKTSGGDKDFAQASAMALIDQMLLWWPNDNMGFRLLKPKARRTRASA